MSKKVQTSAVRDKAEKKVAVSWWKLYTAKNTEIKQTCSAVVQAVLIQSKILDI